MNHAAETLGITSNPSGGFRLEAVQFLPTPREKLFEFFSGAHNLEALTPPLLKFSVLTPAPIHIAEGTIIEYRLRIHGIPLRWKSRISQWQPPLQFVDEQLRGPYRRWHHRHVLEETDTGTLCRDVVDYAVLGGRAIHALFVRPELVKIFSFRQNKLRELFGDS